MWISDGHTHQIKKPPDKLCRENLSDHEPRGEVILRTPF